MALSYVQRQQRYGTRAFRMQSQQPYKALGEIRLKRGRAEAAGVPFNLFPQIADRLPKALSAIVVVTTEAVATKADQKVPVGATGALKASQQVRYYRDRQGNIVTGRIDYNPVDPPGSKHYYGFYVEVGTYKTKAQPFLLPALISERGPFNERCRHLEDLL